MIACDVIAAFLALFWLKPLATRTVEQSNSGLIVPGVSKAEGARTAA
jgi:hypothetical protein